MHMAEIVAVRCLLISILDDWNQTIKVNRELTSVICRPRLGGVCGAEPELGRRS